MYLLEADHGWSYTTSCHKNDFPYTSVFLKSIKSVTLSVLLEPSLLGLTYSLQSGLEENMLRASKERQHVVFTESHQMSTVHYKYYLGRLGLLSRLWTIGAKLSPGTCSCRCHSLNDDISPFLRDHLIIRRVARAIKFNVDWNVHFETLFTHGELFFKKVFIKICKGCSCRLQGAPDSIRRC